MKNLRKISLTLILTLISILLLAVSSKAATKVKVTGDVLNIRKGPSTSTKVVAMLFKGVECELLEEEGDWYKVKYKTYTGYVSKEYAEIIGETNNIEEPKNADTNTDNKNNTDNSSKGEENNITSNTNINENVKIVYKKLKQNSELKFLPLVYSSNIEILKKNTEMILLSEINGWSYVQTDTNCGWIRTEYLEISNTTSNNSNTDNTEKNEYTEKTGYINESSVNMRKGAGTSYNIVKVLSLNTQLTITGEDGKWYKVKVGNTTGYVSKDYVSDKKTTTTRGNNTSRTETLTSNTEKTTDSNTKGEKASNSENTTKSNENIKKEQVETTKATTLKNEQETKNKNETTIKCTDIVAYAKKYLGYKYVYGGDGSNGTFDCSGFTMYVYKHFGIKLPHGANKQYKCGKGTQITKYSDLQVGDIVFLTDYETGVGIGHCGIYLGNDNFIHASTTCYAVEISSFKTIYKGRFYSGLRLI